MNIHFSISSQMNIHLVIHLDNQMNNYLVIHLDNFWVCCPALRLGTSAAFCKWGLLECMLLSSSVLIPPANAWPGRARSTGGNAHDRARSTGGTGEGEEGGGGGGKRRVKGGSGGRRTPAD